MRLRVSAPARKHGQVTSPYPPLVTEQMAERRRAAEALVDRVLGLSEQAAAALAAEEGLPVRVVERDGEIFPLRADLRPGRLNLSLEKGLVTAVRVEREPSG